MRIGLDDSSEVGYLAVHSYPDHGRIAMKRNAWLLGLLLTVGLTGCVDRRYVITSDPPGAVVFRDGKYLGATPVDDHFVYYGDRNFTLIKDGYQTLNVVQNIPAPWYQYWPLDFVTEVLVPKRITDRREFHYELRPLEAVRSDLLLNRGEALRDRSRSITPPASANVPLEEAMPGAVMPPRASDQSSRNVRMISSKSRSQRVRRRQGHSPWMTTVASPRWKTACTTKCCQRITLNHMKLGDLALEIADGEQVLARQRFDARAGIILALDLVELLAGLGHGGVQRRLRRRHHHHHPRGIDDIARRQRIGRHQGQVDVARSPSGPWRPSRRRRDRAACRPAGCPIAPGPWPAARPSSPACSAARSPATALSPSSPQVTRP